MNPILCIVLLFLCVLERTLAVPLTIREVYLTVEACARPEHVPSDIEFLAVESKVECAEWYLENPSVVMLVKQEEDGTVYCAVSSEPQFPVACTDTMGSIALYTTGAVPTCPVPCDTFYDLFGVRYCLHQTNQLRTYTENVDYCNSLNGSLAQAETTGQIILFYFIKMSMDLVYIGANDLQTPGQYLWERGDVVADTLFFDDQPDNAAADENCVAFDTRGGFMPKLSDVPCSSTLEAICAMRCST